MTGPSFPPYNVGDLGKGLKRKAPAAARNVGPIGDTLADWLPPRGLVVEIASGTGEHALAFAKRFPQLSWQPTDPDPQAMASIAAWSEGGPANLLPPVPLDVCSDWAVGHADAIVCINMVHIAPWEAALCLLDGAGRLLAAQAPLILYGPWIEADIPPAPSNRAFDLSLRERDSRWGLRRVEDFAREAEFRGFELSDGKAMPSNNLMLRFVARR